MGLRAGHLPSNHRRLLQSPWPEDWIERLIVVQLLCHPQALSPFAVTV